MIYCNCKEFQTIFQKLIQSFRIQWNLQLSNDISQKFMHFFLICYNLITIYCNLLDFFIISNKLQLARISCNLQESCSISKKFMRSQRISCNLQKLNVISKNLLQYPRIWYQEFNAIFRICYLTWFCAIFKNVLQPYRIWCNIQSPWT